MVIKTSSGIACGKTKPDEIEIETVINGIEYKKSFENHNKLIFFDSFHRKYL